MTNLAGRRVIESMQTDELFYELFQVDPRSLFRLVNLSLEGEYTFESLTIKSTEKRLDGFCKRTDGVGPNVFVEIQGYDDPAIYWRGLREIATFYEQTRDARPFILIFLFLDAKWDPANFPFAATQPPHQVIRTTLAACLASLTEDAGLLTVLKPLLASPQEIREHARQWQTELQRQPLDAAQKRQLSELLEFAIRQRLPQLSEQEIRAMLLTPIEQTVPGQELIRISEQRGRQEGRREGHQKGLTKGEVIGEIRFAQRLLKQPVMPVGALAGHSLKTLKALRRELAAKVLKSNVVPAD